LCAKRQGLGLDEGVELTAFGSNLLSLNLAREGAYQLLHDNDYKRLELSGFQILYNLF